MANFVRDFVATRPASQPALITLGRSGRRRQWTFGELDVRSGWLAARLVQAGVTRGSVVLTLLGNRVEFALAVLACLRIGAATLPCSEQLRPKDLRLRLDRARPAMVICDERNLDALAGAGPDCPVLTVPWVLEAAAPPAPAELGPLDPAFVLFTSGTSGEPKLATHGQRYVWGQRVQAEHWLGTGPGDIFWSTAAPGWSKSARNGFIAPWLAGATPLLEDRRFDPGQRLATIGSEEVNVLCMAPTEYRLIAAQADIEGAGSLRRLVTAGEALGVPAVEAWRARTGLTIADGFGQTETGQLTAVRPGEVAPPGSMGRPLPGVRTRIVDGELLVDPATAPTFFLGYGYPGSAPAGMWHTGDRVREDERGYLYFESRNDDVIISAGYRIGPGEVEAALGEHPAVADCAVIGVPDGARGQLVCAVVVLAPGYHPGDALVAELQRHVKFQTAPYKYPRQVRFVDALPRTTSGKTARAELRRALP